MKHTERPLVSWLLYDTRKKKRLTQEAVCAGICNKGTLSRMESGESRPSYTQVRALFGRLGLHAPNSLIPLTADELELCKINFTLQNTSDTRNVDFPLLLEKLKEHISESDVLWKQEYLKQLGILPKNTIEEAFASLDVLEEAMKITQPGFSRKTGPAGGLYNFTEMALINYMAHWEYRIYSMDKTYTDLKDAAMKKIVFLKDYMEKNVEKYETEYLYSIVLFNLTNWTGLEERYAEALSLAERGIEAGIKSSAFSYYRDQLFNKAYCLIALGQREEAVPLLVQFMQLLKLNDPHNDGAYLMGELKRRFHFEL